MRTQALRLALFLCLLHGGLRPLQAQGGTPRVEVVLSADTGAVPVPVVRTLDLLDDSRWPAALGSGLPIRLHYRLEIWRSRSGWLDELERQVEWDVLVRHEPLLEQYSVVTLFGRGRRERRYATLDALSAALAFAYRVAVQPTAPGDHYYAVTLQISTFSESDLAELDRFLRGEADGDGGVADAMGRGLSRLLLRLAGLPSSRLEARTSKFRVGGP